MKINECFMIEKDDKCYFIPSKFCNLAVDAGYAVSIPKDKDWVAGYEIISNLEFLIDNPRFCGEEEATITLKQYRLLLKLLDATTLHDIGYSTQASDYPAAIFVTKEGARDYIGFLIAFKNRRAGRFSEKKNANASYDHDRFFFEDEHF